MADPTWGIVATIKAPLDEIKAFAAHHLEAGAHRLYLYLDAPDEIDIAALKAHPKIRPTLCDAAYWAKKGKRPAKHQPRQTLNAADAYTKRVEVDWLIHIDVDEYLVAQDGSTVAAHLRALNAECLCARIRPIEALAWDGPAGQPRPFKSFALPQTERQRITRQLYPEFGAEVNGGFLSHVAGKMAYRTGIEGFHVKLHNAFLGENMNPGQVELSALNLCHFHGDVWEEWITQFAYRHAKGAYRAELTAAPCGARSMHEILADVQARGGEAGLRRFWQELCTPRPALLEGLEAHGLLHWHRIDTAQMVAKHFPAH